MRRRSWIMLVALFVASSLVGCGQQDPEAGNREPKEPAAEPRGGPTTTAAPPVGLGETAEVGPFAVTLNAATRTTADGGPDGGARYAVVDLTLENRGREAMDVSGADYMLRDDQGYSFEPGSAPDQRPRPGGRVEPGGKSSGQLAFELGDQRAGGRLQLAVTLPDRPKTQAAYFEFEAEQAEGEPEPAPEPEPEPDREAASEEAKPASSIRAGYSVVEDPSGSLSVEVPSSWNSQTGTDSEGEGGANSWSSYAGEYLTVSITSARSLDAWYGATTGDGAASGVYMVASEALARQYTDDELLYSTFYERKMTTCVEGPSRDIDRPPYSGKVQAWFDCNGLDNASYVFVAAPEGRPCVVVGGAKIAQGASEADREAVEHVVDSFEVDCGSLPPAEPLESSATASSSASASASSTPPASTDPLERSCEETRAILNGEAPGFETLTSEELLGCGLSPEAIDPCEGNPDPEACRAETGTSASDYPSINGPESTPPSTPEPGTAPPQADEIENCDEASGPFPTPPGDPNNLDGDNDGTACE